MEAAFFDLDKTIISRSSSLALSRPLYRAGMVSRSASCCAAPTPSSSTCWSGPTRRRWSASRRACCPSRRGGTALRSKTLVRDVHLRRDRSVRLPGGPRPHGACTEARGGASTSCRPPPRRSCARSRQHFGASGVIATRAEIDETGRYTGAARVLRATASRRPRRCARLAERLGIDLAGLATPTATRSPTCRCSESWAIRWRSTPTAAAPGSRGARLAGARLPAAGSSAHAHREGGAAAEARHRRGGRRRGGRGRAGVGRAAVAHLPHDDAA